MKELLESAGQRSINNVVDISNFVLLEMGHPTHIFDYTQLPTDTIGVRRATNGEKFVTLDEEEHTLDTFHLLITDGKKPVALAGIMGGLGSAVADNSQKVLIESAYFDPVTIRKGSKSLGMLTESSRRFERGADYNGAVTAFWRIVSLLMKYAGGELVSEVVDAYPNTIKQPEIILRKSELDLIAGCEISNTVIEISLSGLHIEWEQLSKDNWKCIPPSFRTDIVYEVDIIEDIIRVFGYDNVKISSRYGSLFNYSNPDPKSNIANIINSLAGLGFRQCYNNSLQSREEAKLSGKNPVNTINPLSEKLSDLRTSLLPGLLNNIDFNIKNGNKDLQLFEIGQIHTQEGKGFKGIIENSILSGLMYGYSQLPHIHNENGTKQSFYTLKGIIDSFFLKTFNSIVVYKEVKHNEFDTCFSIEIGKQVIGTCGIISKTLINKLQLDIEKDVFSFIFDADNLIELLSEPIFYKHISKYPKVERDLNFVIDESVNTGEVSAIIYKNNIKWLKSIKPVNIFRDSSLGENKKSIVYKLIFQDDSKTLEDKDVNSIIDDIISMVKVKFYAKLRA